MKAYHSLLPLALFIMANIALWSNDVTGAQAWLVGAIVLARLNEMDNKGR